MKLSTIFYLAFFTTAIAANPPNQGHHFVCADYNAGKIFIVDPTGQPVWEHKTDRHCGDLQVLPNGNILYASANGVTEVNRDQKKVFEFRVPGGHVFACQRLPDGNTFICESGKGRLITVDPNGEIIREVSIAYDTTDTKPNLKLRNARVLPNGHYLVAHYMGKKVCEYDAEGKKVLEISIPGGAYGVQRLANGNTLISSADKAKDAKLLEVDPDGNTVWEFSNADIQTDAYGKNPLKFLTGFHRLDNGNVLVTNWLGHGHIGKHPQIFEVTPDKKIIWTYDNPKTMKTIVTIQSLNQLSLSHGHGMPCPNNAKKCKKPSLCPPAREKQ